MDDLDEDAVKPWYERFYDDEIAAFECDGYELEFDNPEYAREVCNGYRNRKPITSFVDMDNLTGAKHLIAVKCGDTGVVAGGDRIEVVSKNVSILEEEIEPLSRKWWEYWKNYWRLRGTPNALQKDQTCEVTIPVDVKKRRGFGNNGTESGKFQFIQFDDFWENCRR